MLNRVEPLKNELRALEVEANENRRKNDEMLSVIAGLERSIARYKEEYAILISQAQAIKADLAAVETKVSLFCDICDGVFMQGHFTKFTLQCCIAYADSLVSDGKNSARFL